MIAAAIVVAVVLYVLSPAGRNATHHGSNGGAKDAFIGQVAAYEPVSPDPPNRCRRRRRSSQRCRRRTAHQPGDPLQQHPRRRQPGSAPPPSPPSARALMNWGRQAHASEDACLCAAADRRNLPLPLRSRSRPRSGSSPYAAGSKASPAIDETYMLLPGPLPLALDTAIQSDLPGPPLAHLPGPAYSTKGVLLMEAGTQIIGRYESMKQNAGSRLLATSVFAHTPKEIPGCRWPVSRSPTISAAPAWMVKSTTITCRGWGPIYSA